MASRESGWALFGTEHWPNPRSEAYSNPFSDSFETKFAESSFHAVGCRGLQLRTVSRALTQGLLTLNGSWASRCYVPTQKEEEVHSNPAPVKRET